jgi:hypothetical protein
MKKSGSYSKKPDHSKWYNLLLTGCSPAGPASSLAILNEIAKNNDEKE